MKPSAISYILLFLLPEAVLAQAAGVFSATGSMTTPRFGHTATLLQNGDVLIAGGFTLCSLDAEPCIGTNTAELYDPRIGAFNVTGAMHIVRPVGGVLLPNGKVLFAESYFTGSPAAIEFYDPSQGAFEIAANAETLALGL